MSLTVPRQMPFHGGDVSALDTLVRPDALAGAGVIAGDTIRAPQQSGTITIGVSGARRNASVAACVDGELVAACEQERIARVRRIGLQPGALPMEALATVLRLAGRPATFPVDWFATAESQVTLPAAVPTMRFDHHHAHALTAFHLSPFTTAVILVCDAHPEGPSTTVWRSTDGGVMNAGWPSGSLSLASLYSECSLLFGFGAGQEHQVEALARLDGTAEDDRLARAIWFEDGEVHASRQWKSLVADWLAQEPGSLQHRARIAGVFQRHLGRLLFELLRVVRTHLDSPFLCLGGGLFYNTYYNTVARRCGLFKDVFVAPNPGNAGLAPGVALAASPVPRNRSRAISPFLGPGYDLEEIKATLDNCKLSYECLSEGEVLAVAVDALRRGRLVGWFQGRMEWGHRTLGNRSILASPFAPYVLDNLNTYLKRRERHRTYGFSVPEPEVLRFFEGPPASPFMEYEYRAAAPEVAQYAAPPGVSALRVQTIPPLDAEFHRFRGLHYAFGAVTGIPVLINTSFNGFCEPIVCSPRDAVRVFFGTGIDLLVVEDFVIHK